MSLLTTAPTSADLLTQKIEIDVKTLYVAARSEPEHQRFVFTYTITITNLNDQAVQLISRHWRIHDEHNQVQEIRGIGVVGEQPTIAAGESFTYTSGAMIETPTGMMEGSYQMLASDNESFQALIPTFALVPPHALH